MGRRITILFTTRIMAGTCIGMFLVPTYAEIGIKASIIVIALRTLQGMSSLGEVVGAQLYVTESVRDPRKAASMSAVISAAMILGRLSALVMAKLVMDYTGDWRSPFLWGSIIAVIGVLFRRTLRESCDFVDAKKRLPVDQHLEQKVDSKNILAYFFLDSMCPFAIYIAFIYCPNILKEQDYDMSQILSQSVIVSLFELASGLLFIYLALKFHALKILKFLVILFIPVIITVLWLINQYPSPITILIFQIYIISFVPGTWPAIPIIYKSFPLFQRFKSAALVNGISRAIMYSVTAFGAAILTNHFGFSGLLIILTPLIIGYIWGLRHFIAREKQAGTY